MKHLTAPFFCVLAVGFFAALLYRAIQTEAVTFVISGAAGVLAFSLLCRIEVIKAWPAFTRHLQSRRQLRVAPPFTRIKLKKDDVQ